MVRVAPVGWREADEVVEMREASRSEMVLVLLLLLVVVMLG